MGAKAARMKRLKAAHPTCYFCATSSTETEDHVPSRECFKDRIGPEDFAFPACAKCNHSASQLEQVIALYLLLADHGGREPATKQFLRLAHGVKNNNPELLPIADLGANVARRHYREKGIALPTGSTFADAPIIQLPVGNREAFELFARRLTCALFYKEVGRPLPLNHYIGVAWMPWSDPKSTEVISASHELFPELTVGNRRNTDIGDQFYYEWGYNPVEGLFGFSAHFSKSYLFFGASTAPAAWNGKDNWKLHQLDVANSSVRS